MSHGKDKVGKIKVNFMFSRGYSYFCKDIICSHCSIASEQTKSGGVWGLYDVMEDIFRVIVSRYLWA